MDVLDESCNDQRSIGSACSFQVQLMRCGFLPRNSVSSFDLKAVDLEDLDFKDEDAVKQIEDHSECTASTADSSRCRSVSPKPPKRGMLRTLSLRLSRRNLMGEIDDCEEEAVGTALQTPRRDSRGANRNLGLKKRGERKRGLDRSPMRRLKTS